MNLFKRLLGIKEETLTDEEIKEKLIEWYKKKYYSQGDDYSCGKDTNGKWWVSYSNDYPMQHGSGKLRILTNSDYKEAIKN